MSIMCASCIAAKRFKSWIQKNGRPGKCDFGANHRSNSTVTVRDFVVKVDEEFRSNYEEGESVPTSLHDSDKRPVVTEGSSYEYIVAGMLECDQFLLKEILDELRSINSISSSDGEIPFYRQTNYVPIKR